MEKTKKNVFNAIFFTTILLFSPAVAGIYVTHSVDRDISRSFEMQEMTNGLFSYEKIWINNYIFYLEMTDAYTFSTALQNQLGWITNCASHLYNIVQAMNAVVIERPDFVMLKNIRDEFLPIYGIGMDAYNWFNQAYSGGGLGIVILEIISIRLVNAGNKLPDFIDEAIKYLDDHLLELLDTVKSRFLELFAWAFKMPWYNTMFCEGKVKNVKSYEAVTISCKDEEVTFKDGDDGSKDGVVNYKINVPVKYELDELSELCRHDFRLKIKGDGHSAAQYSDELFCFSDGSLKVENIEFPSSVNENEKNHDLKNTCFDEWDLAVQLNSLEYDHVEKSKGNDYAIYKAIYTVENIGKEPYIGLPDTWVREIGSTIWFDWWINCFYILRVGKTKEFTQFVKIRTSVNDEVDEERKFANHKIVLEVRDPDRCAYPNRPDSNIKIAKYWNDEIDYEPTKAHLLVSTPWRFATEEEFPEIINKRMGWINELNNHLTNITEEADNGEVAGWLSDIYDVFSSMINGTCDQNSLINLLTNHPNVGLDSMNDYHNWLLSEPWQEEIVVKGSVKDLKEGDVVKITCRGVEHTYKVKDSSGVVNYEFIVPSVLPGEEAVFTHDCTISFEKEDSRRKINTDPLFSYCFSGGEIEKHITKKEWDKTPNAKTEFFPTNNRQILVNRFFSLQDFLVFS